MKFNLTFLAILATAAFACDREVRLYKPRADIIGISMLIGLET